MQLLCAPYRRFWGLVSLMCLALSGSHAAADDTSQTRAAPPLRVLTLKAPHANHPHRDIDAELRILSDFAATQGRQIEWLDSFRPSELVDELIAGRGDIVVGAMPVDEALRNYSVATEAFDQEQYRVVGSIDSEIENPLQLAGLRIAVPLSSPLWPYLERLQSRLEGLELVPLPHDATRDEILMLVADRVYDVSVIPTNAETDLLADHPRVKFLFNMTGVEPVGWHIRRDNLDLKRALDDFLGRYHPAYVRPAPAARDRASENVLRIITRLDSGGFFLKGGRPAGFEYELAKRFAATQGRRLEVLVGEDDAQLVEWLKTGAGDLITARIEDRLLRGEPAFSMSRHYRYSAITLVTANAAPIDDLTGLPGKLIGATEGSVAHRSLLDLSASGIVPIAVDDAVPEEVLLARLSAGMLDAIAVESSQLAQILQDNDTLVAGVSLPSNFQHRWTYRTDNALLGAALNTFIRAEYRAETYNVVERLYGQTSGAGVDDGSISPYDEILRTYADRYGFDWRLIAAQMYQESHFDPAAVSSAGARGLMQLMPRTADALGFDDVADPESAIHAGVKYLHELRTRFDRDIPVGDRTWFALAAYNSGYDRVRRARRNAVQMGLDPNRWFGNVEVAMRQMSRTRRDSVASCRCGQAILYVRAIRSLYGAYRNAARPV